MNRRILEKIACAAVSDVMSGLGIMCPGIINMTPGKLVAGIAFTVKCYPGSIITVHQAILEASPGDVLVVDDEGDPGGAVFGELMAMECRRRKLGGIVVDGSVRDVNGLRKLGFPTFARYRTPRVGTNRRLGRTNVPVACGGTVVQPGDYIIGDDDGVAVIPGEQIEQILQAALDVEEKEDELARRVVSGEILCELIGLRDLIDNQG